MDTTTDRLAASIELVCLSLSSTTVALKEPSLDQASEVEDSSCASGDTTLVNGYNFDSVSGWLEE